MEYVINSSQYKDLMDKINKRKKYLVKTLTQEWIKEYRSYPTHDFGFEIANDFGKDGLWEFYWKLDNLIINNDHKREYLRGVDNSI